MKKIGLVIATLLTFSQAEFTRTESGVVTDSQTQLEWQDAYVDNSVPNKIVNEGIDYCNSLDLEGTGWRMPNINELKSLLVDTQFAPSIDAIFQTTVNDWYWSSTKRKTDAPLYNWIVNFSTGETYIRDYDSYNHRIRCVR